MSEAAHETRTEHSALGAVLRHPFRTLLALLLLAIVLLAIFWDWNWFKRPIEHFVQRKTGREFHIDGNLDVDMGWVPRITAEGLRFGNATWAHTPLMASTRKLTLDLEIKPLFRREVRIPEIRLDAPVLNLEYGPGRVGNWVFGEKSDGEGPQFRRVWIDDGKLTFLDRANRTDIHIDVASDAPKKGETAPPIVAQGGGHWEGNAFKLHGRAQSPLALRDDAPYRIDVHASAGPTRAHARGTLLDPLQMRGFDLQFALAGKNLSDLYPLVGVALPDTPPYTLDGRLTRKGTRWNYDDFKGRVGDSDLSGDASVDVGGKRPYLRGRLVSRRLDFDDLAGFVGGAPTAGESTNPELAALAAKRAASPKLLPDTPYNLKKLRAMDADVTLRAHRINAPKLPLDDMDAHLLLESGLLRLEPLNFGVAGGDIRSTVRMDARESTIHTRAKIAMRRLELQKLLPGVKLTQDAVGRIGGDVALAGDGNSIARMLGSSNGDVALGMGKGQISNLLMELAGLDLQEALKFLVTKDRKVPIRCAFGDFDVRNGVMATRSLAFDTTDTIILGEGTVSLRDETLALTLKPRPKDRSLFALRSPLLVSGTFKKPSFRPDMKRVGLRAAIALTLANIAPPAALLATLELGPGEDSNCGGKYAK